MKRRRKPLTERGLQNAERLCAIVEYATPLTAGDKRVAAAAASVEVYDHHKTAQADLADWPNGKVVFDMERSGAGIAWDEFSPDKALDWMGIRPSLVSYVEDRDLWRWALPDSREVSEYLFSLDRTFAEWDRVAEIMGHNVGQRSAAFAALVDTGRTLLRTKRVRVETMCKQARVLSFDGVAVPVVNASWDFSEIGEQLCAAYPEAPCGGYYFDRADKRQWGFRSRGAFDVSALCKRYGGGGHAAAAGFTSEIGWTPDPIPEEVTPPGVAVVGGGGK